MKNKISQSSFFSLLLTAIIFFSFTTIADRPNFSGEWLLNETKSELGEMGGRAARSFKVEQKENAITITRTTPGFGGGDPVTTTMTLTYDGKVTESEGFGGSIRKSTSKWSDDGQTLTVSSNMTFERDGQSMEIKGTETWTMTKDGLLSVVTFSSSPRGEFTTKAVYDKK